MPMDFTGNSIWLVFWARVSMVVALDIHPSVGIPWPNSLPLTNSSVSLLGNTKGSYTLCMLWCTSEAQSLLWWSMAQSHLLHMNNQMAFQHYCSIPLKKLAIANSDNRQTAHTLARNSGSLLAMAPFETLMGWQLGLSKGLPGSIESKVHAIHLGHWRTKVHLRAN